MARQTRGSKSSEAIVKAKGDAQSVRELGKIAQNDFASGAASTARTVDKYADGAYDKIQDTAEYKEGVDRSQDILSAKREAMKGMTSAEMQMNRGAARQQIAGSTQANMRQIASMQAQMGVAGGTASAQQMQAMMAGQSQQAGMEQNLMMQQRQMQEQGLAGFEGTSNNLAQGQMQAKTFDIGTAGQRLGAIQAGATNFANIASSERQAKIAADASVAAARASKSSSCFLPNTLILMADGTEKEIQHIEAEDIIKDGGSVHALGILKAYEFYSWGGAIVGKGHCVKDKWGWVPIELAEGSCKIDISSSKPVTVYNLLCDNHIIRIKGSDEKFGDFLDGEDKSLWSKIYVPYKKLKRGLNEFFSRVFKRGREQRIN